MHKSCEVCRKAAMYTVNVSGLTVCEECADYARAIQDADSRREVYSDKAVTLNGKPARVKGYMNDFATVAPLDTSLGAFEWSWTAVARIVAARGGRFVS